MLQVARLAPKQLGESRDLVAAFLNERVNPDGGFQNRAGASDLYYTVFGLDGLVALQQELPVAATAGYLERFGDGPCVRQCLCPAALPGRWWPLRDAG